MCVEDENKVFSAAGGWRVEGRGVVIGNNLAVGRRARWLPHNLWLRESKTPNQINQRTRTRVRCAQGKYTFLYSENSFKAQDSNTISINYLSYRARGRDYFKHTNWIIDKLVYKFVRVYLIIIMVGRHN